MFGVLQGERESDDEAVDSQGIPGWDRVNKLAEALLSLSGLVVTNAQARNIKALYDSLVDPDKKPLIFKPHLIRKPRGRFARQKGSHHSGHVGVEAMKK